MAFDPDAYLAEPSGFDPDAYLATPTPSPTPTAVAEAGDEDGFLAKINAALRKPSPEWLRAPEEATRENIMAMMPHDVPSYLESLYLPAHVARQTIDMIEPLFHGETKQIPLVGRIQDIIEAEETPAGSKERYGTAERTLMDVGLLAGVGAKPRIPLRAAEPIVPPAARVPSETAALAERITQPRVEPPVTPEVPVTEPIIPPPEPLQKAGQIWDVMTPEERWNHMASMDPFAATMYRKQFVATSRLPWDEVQGPSKDILANTLLYPSAEHARAAETRLTVPPETQPAPGAAAAQRGSLESLAALPEQQAYAEHQALRQQHDDILMSQGIEAADAFTAENPAVQYNWPDVYELAKLEKPSSTAPGRADVLALAEEQPSGAGPPQYPQAAWDSIRQSATHVRKENPSQLITVTPSLKNPDYSRINYWDNRGIISHLEIPTERVDVELQRTAYPRGGVVLSIEGGIGGTLPPADYAGMGFYPSATGTKGVKAFVGPAESVDWMRSRLESGGYKVLQKPVLEEVPAKAGEDFFAAKAEREVAETPPPPTPPVAEPSVPPVPPEDVPFTPEGGGAPARKTRKFSLQLQADTDLIQNLKDKIGNRTYEPIPNKITADQAVQLVDERPIPDVINAIQDEGNGVPGHVRSAMGQIVIKRLNRAAEQLGQSGKTMDADIALNQAVNLAEWMQEFGTRSGQTVQSFAMWQALSPEGKLTSVTRKVRKARANHEHENPGEVGEITDALNLPTEAEKIAAFRKLFRTNKTARKVKPRLQKLIEAARTGKLTEQEFYDIASDRLGLPRYDPQTAAEIMRLALEIDRLPEGMPRDQAVFNLNRFIATKMGFRLSDLPMGVYYGNMLSGYNTHIVNALDTFLNVGSELSGMAIANPRSAMKIFGNSLKGFNEGRADALMALTKGRMLTNSRWMEMPRLMEVAKFGEQGGVPPLGTGLAGRIVTKLAESKAGYPLNAWKYVGRLMSASDSIMFRGAKEGRAALLADRLARDEGLRGKALNRRVQEELGRTTEQETLFRQQAKDEGFSGPSEQARVNELRERGRSMEANADADDFAGMATYNQQPKGVLGYFAKKISEASETYPALRTVVPFTQIVANVTNRGLNYTPLGIRRAFSRYSGEIPKGDAKRAMLMRGVLGSTGLGLLYGLQQQGAVEIHGAGPSDPDKRKQLQEAGWRPYSMKLGDHYVSYLPTPLGLGLSILGNMSDVQRYGEMDQKSALLRGTYALTRVGSTIFSQSFLSSLSTVFEALSGQSPGQQLAAWRRFTSSVVGTVTTPKIVLDVQRIFDPQRYESNTIAGDLLKNTPFSAMVNRPILNAFGERIEPPTNRFISAASDDPAWRAIAGANLRVPVPDKYTTMPDGRGGKRQITPEEYYEYLEKSGPLVKQYIVRDTFNLTHMPPDKAQDLLDKKSQEIRQRVLNDIRRRAQFTPAD